MFDFDIGHDIEGGFNGEGSVESFDCFLPAGGSFEFVIMPDSFIKLVLLAL